MKTDNLCFKKRDPSWGLPVWAFFIWLASASSLLGAGELWQFGTLPSLAAGLYDGHFAVDSARIPGAYGLGTFDKLNGEMVVMDGEVFRVDVSGEVERRAAGTSSPFMCFSRMEKPDWTETLEKVEGKTELEKTILAGLPSLNYPALIVLEGDFEGILTRSVPAQLEPYRPLAEVVSAQQRAFDLDSREGTLVGFYFPPSWAGLNASGFHFHFLSADKKAGGHLLGFSQASGKLRVQLLTGVRLALPDVNSDFGRADFSEENSSEKVKGE